MSGEGLQEKGICVYLEPMHVAVQPKLTQHCRPNILQLKKNLKDELTAFVWVILGAFYSVPFIF